VPPPSDAPPPSGGSGPSDVPPPSGGSGPPAAGDVPPAAPPPPGGGYAPPPQVGGDAGPPPQVVGVVPDDVTGPFNHVWLVILLEIVTCGIWGIFWSYRTNEDLKKYNGDGLGGVLGVVIYLLLSVVLMFTIPNEVEKMYQRDGRQSPVSALWGLWFLLPIIGNIIWYVKVQNALNDFWVSKGARTD
jgi:uncharacterized protein DUF4234